MTLHILAAVAEHEREIIAERTKSALRAAKARGVRLGRNGADRLAPANRAQALERACQLFPVLAELKRAGMSARQMAVELTARGIITPTGGRWHAQTVLRVLGRAGSRRPICLSKSRLLFRRPGAGQGSTGAFTPVLASGWPSPVRGCRRGTSAVRACPRCGRALSPREEISPCLAKGSRAAQASYPARSSILPSLRPPRLRLLHLRSGWRR